MKKLLPLALLLVFACQPSSKKEEVDLGALKDEVFEIHDEVMPKMGDLRRVRKSLMLQIDSLQVSDSLRAVTLSTASDALDASNEGMMDWMRSFDPNFEGTDEEILKYLTEQKALIEEVRKNMLESLSEGQKLLDAN